MNPDIFFSVTIIEPTKLYSNAGNWVKLTILNSHGEHVIHFENSLFYLDISFMEEKLIKLLVMKNIILLLKVSLTLRARISFNK